MTAIGFITGTVNILGTFVTSFYVFGKAIHHPASAKHKALSVLWCMGCSVLFVFNPLGTGTLLLTLIYAASIFIVRWLAKVTMDTAVSAYLLSVGISYGLLQAATLAISLAFAPFLGTGYDNDALLNFNRPIYLLFYSLIAAVQFGLAFSAFRFRRFRNGFPFLFKRYAVVVALVVAGIVLALVSIIATPRESYGDNYALLSIIIGIFIVGAGIFVWVRRGIKAFYRKKMEERGIEILERELAEAKDEILRITAQNDVLRVESHKIIHLLAALERSVTTQMAGILNGRLSAEIGEELAASLADIQRVARNYKNGISRGKTRAPLPSTKIKMLDDLFNHFADKCMEDNIAFTLRVNGSIPYMVENIIEQSKLETLIGDHLQDALNAVNAGSGPFRSVLAILGLADGCYEFTVHDSGIPFEADTLARLGTERVTTRAGSGGSGIGFMTTFQTMRETGASLIIHEKPPSNSDFTKAISIRFDNNNQVIIDSPTRGCY